LRLTAFARDSLATFRTNLILWKNIFSQRKIRRKEKLKFFFLLVTLKSILGGVGLLIQRGNVFYQVR
jgi:hypothetical protein